MMGKLHDNDPSRSQLVGAWLSIGHPRVAEICAQLEFDFLLIDTEHTTTSLTDVENMCRAIDAASGPTQPIVRVPSNDPVRIKRVLDIGAAGIMAPMIETVSEAESLVEAARYPPEGTRGIAGGRAANYGLDFQRYVQNANDSIVTIPQIESKEAVSNVESISSVGGIDAIFVGPADLSASLGTFTDWESEDFTDAIDRIIDAGRDANVPVGTLTTERDDIYSRLEQGFDFLITGTDSSYLVSEAQNSIDEYTRHSRT